MDRLITIDEWRTDYAQKGTHKAFLRDGGIPFQILSITPDGNAFKVETLRGTFRRNAGELILIRQREQRTSVIRKR